MLKRGINQGKLWKIVSPWQGNGQDSDGKYRWADNVHIGYHYQHDSLGIEGILGYKKYPL